MKFMSLFKEKTQHDVNTKASREIENRLENAKNKKETERDFENVKTRKETKRVFENMYHSSFEWFKEEKGNKNWVLYPPSLYEVCRDRNGVKYLHAIEEAISVRTSPLFPPYNASSLYRMFEKCSCERINISKWVFNDSIVDLSFMFYDCNDLKEIIFSNHNSHNVDNMRATFANCYSLKQLDLSWMNYQNIKDIAVCFTWCSSMKVLKIPNLYLSPDAEIKDVFEFCNEIDNLEINDTRLRNLYDRRKKI